MKRPTNFLVLLIILGLALPARAGQQNQARSPQRGAKPPAPAPAPSPNAPRFAFGGNVADVLATFIQDVVLLPVKINDSEPSLFVLDTSASGTSIDPVRAQEIGFSGNQRAALILPGLLFPFDSLPALPRDSFSSDIGRQYEGTIGTDFLSRVVVAIDYARETVRIFDPAAYKYAGHGSVFPLSFSDGMPVIHAKMDTPKGKQIEADFGMNTALIAGVVVSQKFSDAHHVFPSKGKVAEAYDPQLSGGEKVSLFRLRWFKVAGSAAEDTIAELSRSKMAGGDDPKIAGVIGARFLRRFNIVLDYPHRQIIFEANTHFHDYDEEDKSGIAVIAKGPNLKTFEVVHVAPDSPAVGAGIQTGDVIAGIDDEASADMSLASVRYMFRQVGHKYKVTLQRGDKTREVTIQMERLLE
jgi:membrane-associated protease RseP (regulator of RpoE activity)